MKHERDIYNFLDLIGDLGGVLEVFLVFFAFFIEPISEHSFYMKALSKLFVANTKEKKYFKKDYKKRKLGHNVDKHEHTQTNEDIKQPYKIKIDFLSNLWL